MRSLLLVWMVVAAAAAHAENIVEVLQRSQQTRLDAMRLAEAGSERARTIRASFDTVQRFTPTQHPVELRVVEGDTLAETLLGRVVVANVVLAERTEAERRFILAHELGHVTMDHQSQMGFLYRKWVPDAVTQERTDAVAGRLGRDASGLAHQQEFSADAFALRTLCEMGYARDEVIESFMHLGMNRDTATHPSTARRTAALRAADVPPAQVDSLALVR